MIRPLIAVILLAACTPTPDAPGPTGEAPSVLAQRIRADNERLDRELSTAGLVAAGIGETADLGGGLTVRPLEVIEDSRCAGDVTCVWAGRLRVRADISGVERELTLGEPLETPSGAVILAVAKPGAWSQWPSELGARPAYRFGFRRG